MTPKAQWMAMATALGWKNLKWIESHDEATGEHQFFGLWADNPEWKKNERKRVTVPDYLGDLNCSWGFESVIETEGKADKFLCNLSEATTGNACWKVSEANHWACATATASQRAECFLRAMDLWAYPEERA
jgi:hypothetical protein